MATTYTLISSNTLSASAASVTFSSIPSTYTDLVLRVSARLDSTAGSIRVSVDNNGSATYSSNYIYGNGSTVTAGATTTAGGNTYWNAYYAGNASTSTASTFSNTEIYIPNYALSSIKPVSHFSVIENNVATSLAVTTQALLKTTAQIISQIDIAPNTGNFVSGSSFYLYGIKNS